MEFWRNELPALSGKPCRVRAAGGAVAMVLALFGAALLPAAPASPAVAETPAADGFNVPEHLRKRVLQRGLMDLYAARFHAAAEPVPAGTMQFAVRRRPFADGVRVVRAQLPGAVLTYRETLDQAVHPLRGFRAPILDAAGDLRAVMLADSAPIEGHSVTPEGHTNLGQVQLPTSVEALRRVRVAEIIRTELAHAGLLPTLAVCLQILGPAAFATNNARGVGDLWELGFPVDLLAWFAAGDPAPTSEAVIQWTAAQLADGVSPARLENRLAAVPFTFRPTHPRFRAAAENGLHEIGLVRLQVGGGYRGGLVRGGSIDVTGQLLGALPEAEFLATVPEEHLGRIRHLAMHSWPVRRPNRLTLVAEPGEVTPWAQDNGKAGFLAGVEPGTGMPATLAPRYASQHEIEPVFLAGDSFLMDGLRAAGHDVVHSPLLFQGGNLLVVQDTRTRRRVLLISETEVCRNLALGLTRPQVLAAFQGEFAVDECVVLPVVSYHLDYDVTVRMHDGQMIAFVNDAPAAARIIVRRVIDLLTQHAVLSAGAAHTAQTQLATGQLAGLVRTLAAAMAPYATSRGPYQISLVRLFAASPTDSAELNFQALLAAVDVLASEQLTADELGDNTLACDYFAALRDLAAGAQAQQQHLRALGWKVVPVPSMPDLYRSLNYLNGLHDRGRYVMPVWGGLYASLDNAAAAVFQSTLGAHVQITRIFTQDLQGQHGAVHCVAAAYPKLLPARELHSARDPNRFAAARP